MEGKDRRRRGGQFHFSGKTSCAVGAPPSMKMADLGGKSFTFSTGSGSFHSSAFYKGESQEKNFSSDWKEQRCSPCDPARVMKGGSGGFSFLFLQIHPVIVTTFSASGANKQCGWKVPTMVLSETPGL